MSKKVHVPDFKGKLDLLIQSGRAGTIKGLAQVLKVPLGTLTWWLSNAAGRAQDHARIDIIEKMTAEFAELLPEHDRAAVSELVLGPLPFLNDALGIRIGRELMPIIEREAVRARATLFPASDEIGLVEEVEHEDRRDLPVLKLGQAFRLEFKARHDCPYAFAVQNGGQEWGRISLGEKTAPRRVWLAPKPRVENRRTYIHERVSRGLHRFICFLAPQPFPAVLGEYKREGIALDKRALETLAAFWNSLPERPRECQLLELTID